MLLSLYVYKEVQRRAAEGDCISSWLAEQRAAPDVVIDTPGNVLVYSSMQEHSSFT